MGAGMKRTREEPVSLSTTDSTSSVVTSADSGAGAPAKHRRGGMVAMSGEGEFVYKTCGRAVSTFLALGGHRTSHLRGCHGLELGVCVARAIKERKKRDEKQHRGADDREVALLPGQEVTGHHAAADQPPVLLELFV